ncbi:putative Acyl-CoA synthetase [Monocercomonoides exilis]|uniref:putative Acyl-CoA synthetase n=1 Tax=Monocercomonoides exilis TaxID=2049356 RepID=UPI00355AAADF|nr:putative Acyl-CoA synthetase [Monocercomonoides exilis]|eukprot:MONOS_2053.1-p1 / transcript=MONOS_2053.1 / gene=MONOS_2053 / organism=Monocercomonoides_exilis_PA203 / gene_product=Acyl-CoA synthetase / transcript_product=Acyl-CoA synthetase / location=Mono_scaffold00040:51243-54092(-) / protein_length=932 / sequence_SO=supercontig / SO=protein_coding / is_pseudo=false
MEKDMLPVDGFFEATSIAIIGASHKDGTPGWAVSKQVLKSFKRGPVYLVNPKGGTLFDQPVYKSIDDIPSQHVDLAVIVVPARFSPQAVKDMSSKKSCKYMVNIAGGFADIGAEGKAIQNELKKAVESCGVRLIGPNGVGFYSAFDTIDCLFILDSSAHRPIPGGVSIASQSGGFGVCMFNHVEKICSVIPWIGKMISLGNSINVCEADMMEYFERDEHTKIAAFYLEGIQQPTRFLAAARRARMKGKGVFIVKSGATPAGSIAIRSHSASVAVDDAVTDALLKENGIVRCVDWRDMFAVKMIGEVVGQRVTGKKVQIITNGGGQGVQLVDALWKEGLELGMMSDELKQKMIEKYPPFYIVKNPLDMTGSGTTEDFSYALRMLRDDPGSDVIVLSLIGSLKAIDSRTLCHEMVELYGRKKENWNEETGKEREEGENERKERKETENESESNSDSEESETTSQKHSNSKQSSFISKRKSLYVLLIGAQIEEERECTDILMSGGIPVFSSEVDVAKAVGTQMRSHCFVEKEKVRMRERQETMGKRVGSNTSLASLASLASLEGSSASSSEGHADSDVSLSVSSAASADQTSTGNLTAEIPIDISVAKSVSESIRSAIDAVAVSAAATADSTNSSDSTKAKEDHYVLPESSALKVLMALGISVPPFKEVHSAAEAEAFVEALQKERDELCEKCEKCGMGKVMEFVVKSGCEWAEREERKEFVKTHIAGVDGLVGEAVEEMLEVQRESGHEKEGVIVMECLTTNEIPCQCLKTTQFTHRGQMNAQSLADSRPVSSVPLFVGVHRDPTFGPVLIGGLGGSLVSAVSDVSFALCPCADSDATDVLHQLRTRGIFEKNRRKVRNVNILEKDMVIGGAVDAAIVNEKAVAKMMSKISSLPALCNEIQSIDLNPVVVRENQVWAVDARFVMKRTISNVDSE